MASIRDVVSQVGSTLSSIGVGLLNPAQTITGLGVGVVRGKVGAPVLMGSNTSVNAQAKQTLGQKPSINGSVTASAGGFLNNIAQGIGTAVNSVVGKVQNKITPTSTSSSSVGDRLVDIGLSGVQNLVDRLTGGGNRENPKPATISTGYALGSSQDNAVFSQSPGNIPAGQDRSGVYNGAPGSPLDVNISNSKDGSDNLMPILAIGALAIGAVTFLRNKR